MDSFNRRNQASKLIAHGLAVAAPGRAQFLPQVEPAQVPLARLVQFQDQHDVSGEVEIVPHVARLQVGVEDSDSQVLKALRVVRKVTDETRK